MTKAVVQTDLGAFAVDLETEELEPADENPEPKSFTADLPRVVGGDRVGSTVVAVVDRKPPLMISHDAGITWREAGAGLPQGRAVVIDEDDPDLIVYASRNRLHVSTNGGVFWRAHRLGFPKIRRSRSFPQACGRNRSKSGNCRIGVASCLPWAERPRRDCGHERTLCHPRPWGTKDPARVPSSRSSVILGILVGVLGILRC